MNTEFSSLPRNEQIVRGTPERERRSSLGFTASNGHKHLGSFFPIPRRRPPLPPGFSALSRMQPQDIKRFPPLTGRRPLDQCLLPTPAPSNKRPQTRRTTVAPDTFSRLRSALGRDPCRGMPDYRYCCMPRVEYVVAYGVAERARVENGFTVLLDELLFGEMLLGIK